MKRGLSRGDEVQAELDAHFEGTVEILVRRGWTEAAAREEVRRRFGDVDRYRTELERIGRHRRLKACLWSLLDRVKISTSSAVRGLRRSPGFSSAVIVTLGLGIGANAAVFGVADQLLLSPPPGIEAPSEVRWLYQVFAGEPAGQTQVHSSFTYADVQALRRSGLDARLAAFFASRETLGEGESAIRVNVGLADSAFLPLLGVKALRGRSFVSDDHRTGAPPIVLLGHNLWKRRFGSDPSIIGQSVRAGDGTYVVAGVLPPGFVGAMPRAAIDIWLPLEAVAEDIWGPGWTADPNILAFSVLARFGAGATPEPVFRTEAAAFLRRSRADYPVSEDLLGVISSSLVPGDYPEPGALINVSRWLVWVSLLVLLVACANVANLFLVHSERTRRETAVRMALGAGTLRIRFDLLLRALLLALLGGVAALALAFWGGRALQSLFAGVTTPLAEARAGRMLVFTGLVAVAAATLAGLLPALRAPRAELRSPADGGRITMTTGVLRRTLGVVQTTLSFLLLVGATLFVLSLRSALELNLGFEPEGLVMVRLERETDAGVAAVALYRDAEESLRHVPGVMGTTLTVAVPFVTRYGRPARRPDQESFPRSADGQPFQANAVGAHFFRTMAIPLLRGRGIEAADLLEGAEPVAVVSPTAAARLWPGEDPLNKCILVGPAAAPCARVVGVAAEHVQRAIDDPPAMMAWVPLGQPRLGTARAPTAIMVRVQGDAGRATQHLQRHVLALSAVRYAEVRPLTDLVSDQLRSWRLGATVFTLFGLVALAVATFGLYAVLAWDVMQRRKEIGIRIALGARAPAIIARIMLGAGITVGVGVAAGILASFWGAQRLESLLFRVSAHEPAVFAFAAATLFLTAAGAAALPAVRATRVNPRDGLTTE